MAQALDRAITQLTDGHVVDWEDLLEDAVDARERALLEELRGLSQLDIPALEPLSTRAGATVGASSGPEAPQRWAHLELLDELGRGAYGAVYRAWDARLAREVAVKLLDDTQGGASLEEARRLARVSHPNVVSIYGTDRAGGRLGLWMELLKGRTLDEIVRDQGPFSVRETVAIALDICGAVAAIHRAGLVHRDIKGQNIMREPGGRLVLMDLGASVNASHEDVGVRSLAGTPLYMAPELFEGEPASIASDIYAVGVLLYRLVTGEFPVHGHTIGDVRRAHAISALRPLRDARPDLPSNFIHVVEGCLAADPRKRFAGTATLERALIGLETGRPWQQTRRGRRIIGVAAVGIMLFVVSAVLVWPRMTTRGSTTDVPIPADQYKMFAAYEELAFSKRIADSEAAAEATNSAYSLLQSTLQGNRPVYALLRTQLSEEMRRAGNLVAAGRAAENAQAHASLSVGETHPYAAVVALEMGRNAQAAGDHRRAAAEILRALEIRWRVLGLSEIAARTGPLLDAGALERQSAMQSAALDTDGDGILDLVEAAAGLNPASIASAGTGALDDEQERLGMGISNRLALGVGGSPYTTWAQYGAYQPRYLAWQTNPSFPMTDGPQPAGRYPAWSVGIHQPQSLFEQVIRPPHAERALQTGFSLLLRIQPVKGVSSALIDLAPFGPRFDVAVRRLDSRALEVTLLSSVIPRTGTSVVVEAPESGRWPLLELRYRPQWKSAKLFVDGRQVSAGYTGHHQYQHAGEGLLAWGVMADQGPDAGAEGAFNLFWFEIFGAGR